MAEFMKKQIFFVTFVALISTFFAGWIQTKSSSSQGTAGQHFRSTHQVEWERHKNFLRKDKEPAFEGTPVVLTPRNAAPNKEIFGYLPYWVFSNYPNLNYNLLTTIAYFGAEVDAQGNLTNLHDWPAPGLINKAHSEGVRVVLTAVSFNSNSIASILSDSTRRTRLVNNLLTQVQSANADGIQIDFEGVPSGQRANLTTFMTELTDAFHSAIPGSFVTIFTPAVDWSDVFDYFSLAQITDGLVISGYDYHWSAAPTAGPVSPLTGTRWGFFNVTWTVSDYLSKTFSNTSKLILGLPFYGFDWPTASDALEAATTDVGESIFYSEAYPNALQYGRLWDEESQSPWYKYNDGQWHQGWYDDSLSLAKKFEFVIDQDLKGIGIWALSYDGERQELLGALADAFGATAPPLKPTAFYVLNMGDGRVQIASKAASGATGYNIYKSTDGDNFDQGTEFPNAVNVLSNLSPDSTYYFKMSAINGNGESNSTEVLAVHPTSGQVGLLIVNGVDRTIGTVNTFDFVKRFAPAVTTGYAFDSCSNEAIENGDILLAQYEIVLWISGEEGTANESFSQREQSLLARFLESGGKLFISGSEIGYDLVEKGSTADKSFYRTYFKAQYVRDKVATHSASGTSAGIFNGVSSVTFDNGAHGTYNVDFPDGIKPVDGAVLSMAYNGFSAASFGGAGIQYAGPFGNSTIAGKLVYLGFPFETIYPESSRDLVMKAVLKFLGGTLTGVEAPLAETAPINEFELIRNYPNPFNPSTTIVFRLTGSAPLRTRLKIYNLRGREIITLMDESKSVGRYSVQWDGRDSLGKLVASGKFIYRLQVGERAQAKTMTLLR